MIFGGLLVFALVTSYISYKIKQSGRLATAGVDGKSTTVLKPKGSYPRLNSNNDRGRKQQVKFPRTKSIYHKEEREVGNRKIDVIYRERTPNAYSNPGRQRITKVDYLNSSDGSFNQAKGRVVEDQVYYGQQRIQENEILKYYEDF